MSKDNRMVGQLSKERAEFLERDYVQGFPAYIGYKVQRVDYGAFDTRLVIEPRHTQQDRFVHAGVMATMADHTMGYAAYTTVPENIRILTIEYKINFLKPAVGDELICRAKVISLGRKIVPTEAEIFVVSGGGEKLVSKAMATMAAVAEDTLANK